MLCLKIHLGEQLFRLYVHMLGLFFLVHSETIFFEN